MVENDGNPVYEVTRSSEGQGHERKEPAAGGRNLSLEALFQVLKNIFYCKNPKHSDTRKICCNHSKI